MLAKVQPHACVVSEQLLIQLVRGLESVEDVFVVDEVMEERLAKDCRVIVLHYQLLVI